MTTDIDVAIIGGGPAGTTTGTLLKKYGPDLKVLILEREKFPRDHVGESQLPAVSYVLDEMGVWDKVEAADFPVKIGATYKWGRTNELWDLDFIGQPFQNSPRPGKFEGQRRYTAFQVDRAVYDEILLNHAREMGCDGREESRVVKVLSTGDYVDGLVLDNGETITAKYYVDASGNSGILRRAMDVAVESPTTLQNIAVWDYWQNAEWAEEIGVGGTRVQVMTIDFGWIWFIPLSPTRTSVGLVTPKEHYRQSGLRPEELYEKALTMDDRIISLMKSAVSEGKFATTKDWSFVAERHSGENWFLAGETSGFADPILAAGLNISQAAAREVAFSILEMIRGKEDSAWLRDAYDRRTTKRITNHIRFADYWYTTNKQFSDLKEFTQQLARDNHLDLSADKAWQWLAAGGFIDEDLTIGTAGFSLSAIRGMAPFLNESPDDSPLFTNNVFELNLEGANRDDRAHYFEGRVLREPAYTRGSKVWPLSDVFDVWFTILSRQSKIPGINREIATMAQQHRSNPTFKQQILNRLVGAIEALITDGWVIASYDPSLPLLPKSPDNSSIHWHDQDVKTGQR
ncbi:hypothetical protein BH11ARM1_BH11ARM1_10490 [soil metagenome]